MIIALLPAATARMITGAYMFHATKNLKFTYRAEVGEDSGCCIGSLTVYAINTKTKRMAKVFYKETFFLSKIVPTKSGILVIGQSSDSEARALRNASGYDPYQVYVVVGAELARYDLGKSKAYSEQFYCPWRGPKYNEGFVAVTVREGLCQTMTSSQFNQYREVHPQRFAKIAQSF